MSRPVWCSVESPVGTLIIVAAGAGLQAIRWAAASGLPAAVPEEAPEDPLHPLLAQARDQLGEYFRGDRTAFDLPLAPAGTPFQLRAWEALTQIPYGEVRTYAEQAARIGKPAAVRAVGAANGRNPLPIIVPCHRVIGSDGRLTGFAGGLAAKQWLLDHERAHRAGLGTTLPLWP